eukprot:GHVS01105721.1.p1 GENE.GHVS01105721.1~~GHVS01105721.1.p1  ORF type:complete len:535 (+),score=106.07 GHVS01105721.1:53-1606(+)
MSLRRSSPFTFLVCLLLTSSLFILLLSSCAAADPVSGSCPSSPPSGNCPSCADCSSHANVAAQAEDRLTKMAAELSHLKHINEESVKACNLVSQKQVESLEECQRSQQQLGELFNKAQGEKQELSAKADTIMRESIEKEVACGKRVEAAAVDGTQKVAEAEAKAMAAEQADASKGEAEKVMKELSAQLDGAGGRIRELMEEVRRKDSDQTMWKETTGKVEGSLKAELAAEQKKHQTSEKSFQKAQSEVDYIRSELDAIRKKSNEGSGYLYSYRTFHNSVVGLRDVSLSMLSFLFARVPQSYKDYVTQTYTEYRLSLVDSFFSHPKTQHVLRISGQQWESVKALYSAHLGGENGHVAALTRKLSAVTEGAHSRVNDWNEALTRGVLHQFVQEHPEVKRLFPDGVLDRVMCCLFFIFAMFVAYKLVLVTAFRCARFALCQICFCRICSRRDSSRGTKKVHSTKKRLTSPTSSSSSSSSGQRKKPTESLQSGAGKAFRPDESSGTATTTSSSTGNGTKRK